MSVQSSGIIPATLAFATDGTPWSDTYQDIYHPRAGGLAQAQHVFLGGNDLPGRWQGRPSFVILETGFGAGLNFLATWNAWRQDPARCPRLHFLSVEKHPFRRDDLRTLHAAYPEVADLARQLQDAWPELTAGFHRLEFADHDIGEVVLTLAFGDAMACLPQFIGEPDAIFLDGFSPARNPDLWSPRLLNEIALLGHAGTTLATWSVAAATRDALTRAGFILERRAGFSTKNEMLVGHLPDDTAAAEPSPPAGGASAIFLQVVARGAQQSTGLPAMAPAAVTPVNTGPITPDAVVVGAGLAGALIAEALTRRGLRVELFERNDAAAMETSGNRTAVMLPMLSLDDNRASRLNRACYLHALRSVAQWRAEGLRIDGEVCGVLQIGRDAEHAAKQQEILDRCGFPPSYVSFLAAEAASEKIGLPVAGPGWWFAGGAWWNPPSLCRAALQRAGDHLGVHYNTAIEHIEYSDGYWHVFASDGQPLARTRQLILASAHDLVRLPQTAHLPLFRFRGQVTHLPAPQPSPLKAVVCKEGYLSPAWQGQHCVGASFHRNGEPGLRDSDHLANLERLQSMLPGYLANIDPAGLTGRVGFRPVSPDKMPIVGTMYRPDATPRGRDLSAVERWPGLSVATGYGARGLVWSSLMADLLASQIIGEPLPLESDLAAICDPARFLLRRKDS